MEDQKAPAAGGAAAEPPAGQPKSGTQLTVQGLSSMFAMVAALAIVVGLILMLCANGFRVGLFLLVFGLPVAVVGAVAVMYDRPWRRTVTALVGIVLLLLMWVGLTAGLAGLGGQIVRWTDPADYVGRYGSMVTATLPDQCTNEETTRGAGGAPAASKDYVCAGSTWQLKGVSHTGTIVLGWGDVDDEKHGVGVPDSAQAYVLGDKGYSVKRIGKVDSVATWGSVPTWYLLGLPLFVIALVVFGIVGFTNPKVSTPEVPRQGKAPAAGG